MIIWGVTALGHDGAISVVKDNKIVFAGHTERYTRIKNDPNLCQEIVDEALSYGYPDEIVWYEKPLLKKTRQVYAGQWKEVFGKNTMPKKYLKKFGLGKIKVSTVKHHEAHAAAGVFTSGYKNAAVVVLDAIGEWNCCSIWKFNDGHLKLIENNNYPHSFGLFYSAFTQRCGLKPNEEEYILMGMAAYGQKKYTDKIWNDFINEDLSFKQNLHIGVGDYLPDADIMDIAASCQEVANRFIYEYVSRALLLTGENNLVQNFMNFAITFGLCLIQEMLVTH
jgi:carbamoyltransferase